MTEQRNSKASVSSDTHDRGRSPEAGKAEFLEASFGSELRPSLSEHSTHTPLTLLLEAIEFSQYDPASHQDGTHRVFVFPRPSEREGYFDALVTITPHNPDAAPPKGVTLSAIPRAGAPLGSFVEAKTNISGQAWLRDLPFGDYSLGAR